MKTRTTCALVGAAVALAGCKTMPVAMNNPQTMQAVATVAAAATAPQVAAAPAQPAGAVTGPGGCTYLPGTEPRQPQAQPSTQSMLIGAALGALAGGAIGRSAADKKSVGTRNGILAGALIGALAGSQFKEQVQVAEAGDGLVKMNIPGSVLFPTGRSDLNPQFRQTLDGVVGVLNQYCDVSAIVVGHTDSTGSVAVNEKLSMDRASSVVNHMAGKFPIAKLVAEGRAAREPVASNDDPAGRALNRRVEIFIKAPPVQ